MLKGSLAFIILLLLLPLANANVGWTNPPYYSMAYYCANSNLNPIWQYFYGDIVGDIDMKVQGQRPSGYGEIPNTNGQVCWSSTGTKVDVTSYVRGIFAEGPAIERGYLQHPPIAWFPYSPTPNYPTYPPTYVSPSSCRVDTVTSPGYTYHDQVLAIPGWTPWPAAISYIIWTNNPTYYKDPYTSGNCVPPSWCWCHDLKDAYGNTIQGSIFPGYPHDGSYFYACQQGTMSLNVVCEGWVKIYEVGNPTPKANLEITGNAASNDKTMPTQQIAIGGGIGSSHTLRSDLFIQQCGVYTVSDQGNVRFYKDSIPSTEAVTIPGNTLTFQLVDCAPPPPPTPSCTIKILGSSSKSQDCTTGGTFNLKVEYANIPSPGTYTAQTICDPPSNEQNSKDFTTPPAAGTVSGNFVCHYSGSPPGQYDVKGKIINKISLAEVATCTKLTVECLGALSCIDYV